MILAACLGVVAGVSGCANTPVGQGDTTNALTLNQVSYAAYGTVQAIETTAKALAVSAKINKQQAQSVADQTKAIRASIAAVDATGTSGTTGDWTGIYRSIAAVQTYLTSVAGSQAMQVNVPPAAVPNPN